MASCSLRNVSTSNPSLSSFHTHCDALLNATGTVAARSRAVLRARPGDVAKGLQFGVSAAFGS